MLFAQNNLKGTKCYLYKIITKAQCVFLHKIIAKAQKCYLHESKHKSTKCFLAKIITKAEHDEHAVCTKIIVKITQSCFRTNSQECTNYYFLQQFPQRYKMFPQHNANKFGISLH